MNDALRRFVRDVLGRNAGQFVELLTHQIDAAVRAADLLVATTESDGDLSAVARKVQLAEDEGDRARAALVAELSRALTTPMDREDLFRLSRSIDDVLDYLRDFADELVLFEPARVDRFSEPLVALRAGLVAMRDAVSALDGSRGRLEDLSGQVKSATTTHDAYQRALLALFSEPVTVELLKCRELLRRLDVAGLRLEEAANALADGTLKRG